MQNRHVKAALIGAASCLFLVGSVQAQNLLTNGSLDDTYQQLIVDNPDPDPDFFLPKPTAWVNEGFRTITGPYEDEMSSEPWAGPAPTPVTMGSNSSFPPGAGLDAGAFFKAFSGNLTNGPATGHLYQDVPATPGLPYTLTGWAGAEANLMVQGAEIALEFLDAGNNVLPGSVVVDLLPTLFVDNGEAFDYKMYTASGVAPAGTVSARARVSMLGGEPNPAGGGQAFVVDDFALVVPEPASLGLISLAGLALLGRRRA